MPCHNRFRGEHEGYLMTYDDLLPMEINRLRGLHPRQDLTRVRQLSAPGKWGALT